MPEHSEEFEPLLTVRALSDGPGPVVLAKSGPVRGDDLAQLIEEVLEQVRGGDKAGLRDFRIECVASDLVRVPSLSLEPALVAELAERSASLDVELRTEAAHEADPDLHRVSSVPPQIELHFSVVGFGFEAAQLTARTGLAPDDISQADRAAAAAGKRFFRRDTWTLESGIHRAADYTALLDAMLARVAARAAEIRAFCAEYGAKATIEFVAEFVRHPPRLKIEARHFAAIKDLGAGLWYDLYRRDRLD